MKKNILSKIACAAVAFGLFAFAGCSNGIGDSDSVEYGSIVINTGDRSVDVSSVRKALVTVTGNGIDSPLTATTSITSRSGSVTIEKIPAGANRIITVQGKDSSNADVPGAVIRAVADIHSGVNSGISVNWETSKKGYVYNALFESGVNISELTSSQISKIDSATPTCDAENINLSLFVSDFLADSLGAKSKYVLDGSKSLKRIIVVPSDSSTSDAPAFIATAYYSDGTNEDVTSIASWTSTLTSVAQVSRGKVSLLSEGTTVVRSSYTYGGVTKTGAEQTLKVTAAGNLEDKTIIFVKAGSAPCIWVWEDGGEAISEKGMGLNWNNESASPSKSLMQAATTDYMTNPSGWFMYDVTDYVTPGNTKKIKMILNWNGGNTINGEAGSFWYDGSSCSTTNPYPVASGKLNAAIESEVVVIPSVPTVTITPASGKVGLKGSIKVSYSENNATVTSANVRLTGAVSKTYTLSNFSSKALSISIEDLGITTAGKTINVSVSVTNEEGTTSKNISMETTDIVAAPDTFTWDNVNCYFVLTDRFYNGDTRNDHSYFRQNGLDGDEDVATFHGGDLAGLTQKLDYFDKLGVNAIWITAPYEQAHGWVGGKNGAFPHYAFHGYYTLDWSCMDQNMGTVEELRTFVNACHSKGIRVIMDVVMNHVGYNNTQDMITYKHGYTEHTNGWLAKTGGKWDANDTVKWDGSYWDSSWFGPWIRSFGYDTGSEYGGSCGGLPDVKTELTSSVGMAPVLVTKWSQEKDSDPCTVAGTGNTTGNKIGDYRNPSVSKVDWLDKKGDYRTDMGVAPADYQVAWLSAWVREVGIDGFRCDTAKHVEPFRWGQLKKACTAALEAWRKDSSKSKAYNGADTGAADWDEAFWMTGECFGWTSTSGQGDYYTTGGFDSMINFSFNGSAGSGTSSNYPNESSWSSYININKNADSDNNGNRNNVLTYLSSHDTKLCRTSNQIEVGTMFTLLPGGIQIYYGDETSRPQAYTGCGDSDMATRGDFNWSEANGACATHWGKVGNFRKYNPAVGAGTGSSTKRTYSGTNAGGENKIAISITGTSVDVSGLFTDGTTVYNWYDGKSSTVSGGKVSFQGGTKTQPILVSDRNPADFGVSF